MQLFDSARLRMPASLTESLDILKRYKRAYIVVNLASAAIFFTSIPFTQFFRPELKQRWLANTDAELKSYALGRVLGDAYVDGQAARAASLTFVVNMLALIAPATLPSFLVPCSGLALLAYRFALWGVNFAPLEEGVVALLPHYLTMAFEGEAYVIAGLAKPYKATWCFGRSITVTSRVGGVESGREIDKVALSQYCGRVGGIGGL